MLVENHSGSIKLMTDTPHSGSNDRPMCGWLAAIGKLDGLGHSDFEMMLERGLAIID